MRSSMPPSCSPLHHSTGACCPDCSPVHLDTGAATMQTCAPEHRCTPQQLCAPEHECSSRFQRTRESGSRIAFKLRAKAPSLTLYAATRLSKIVHKLGISYCSPNHTSFPCFAPFAVLVVLVFGSSSKFWSNHSSLFWWIGRQTTFVWIQHPGSSALSACARAHTDTHRHTQHTHARTHTHKHTHRRTLLDTH